MSYSLSEATIKTNNTKEGMQKIAELFESVFSGRIPLLMDSDKNPRKDNVIVSKYHNFESDENGYYDLSLKSVSNDFIADLAEQAIGGVYAVYKSDADDGDIKKCIQAAWGDVWRDSKAGKLKRAFTCDYEYSIPAMSTNDGKARCILYISIEDQM